MWFIRCKCVYLKIIESFLHFFRLWLCTIRANFMRFIANALLIAIATNRNVHEARAKRGRETKIQCEWLKMAWNMIETRNNKIYFDFFSTWFIYSYFSILIVLCTNSVSFAIVFFSEFGCCKFVCLFKLVSIRLFFLLLFCTDISHLILPFTLLSVCVLPVNICVLICIFFFFLKTVCLCGYIKWVH